MNNGQLSRHLALLIFKMSDSGFKKVNDWFISQGEFVRDKAVREFSYLKGFLVECLCYEASTVPNDAQMIMGLTVQRLGESWARWSGQNYGCNVTEMLSRFKEYHGCYNDVVNRENFDTLTRLFINNIGEDYFQKAGISFSIMNNFVKNTFYKISKSVVEKTQGGGGCYIATCVYGSYDCPEVWVLRRFRDNILMEKWYGRIFINVYYAVSPTLVRLFGHTKWFNNFCKPKLDKLVSYLNDIGIENTPYID